MKINNLIGLGKVYKYTFLQLIKKKSFIITSILFLFASLAVFPIVSIMNGNMADKIKDEEILIDTIYVVNTSDLTELDFSQGLKDINKEFNVIKSDETVEQLQEKISAENENSIVLDFTLNLDEGGYIMNFSYDKSSDISKNEVEYIANTIYSWFSEYKISSLNLDANLVSLVNSELEHSVVEESDYIDSLDDNPIAENDFWLIYAVIFIIYLIITLTAASSSTSIAEEKTNKIVEYLLTTVRPMALILGKILANITVSLCQYILLALSAFCSSKLNNAIFGKQGKSLLSNFFSADTIKSVSVLNITLVILILGIGILMYSLISGLFASCATKMEEVGQTMSTYVYILMIGFILSFFALSNMSSHGFNGFVLFTIYFPLSSVMMLPSAIILGKASALTILISILLLIATTIAILWVVSLCYETVIVSNGAPVTKKQLVEIIKNSLKSKKNAKAEAVKHEK